MRLLALSFLLVSLPAVGLVADGGDSASSGLSTEKGSRFIDPEDGWFDLSSFIDDPAGFVPLVTPITEEAVGLGAGIIPVFISKNPAASDGSPVRPNILALGGFKTENDSEGFFGVHTGNWMDGRVKTTIGGISSSVNLDFYGLGNRGRQYNIETRGLLVDAKVRIGDSPVMVGLGYLYAEMDVSFESNWPALTNRAFSAESQLGAPILSLSYDTRDNIFTPGGGTYAELTATFHEPFFGASSSFQRVDLVALRYWKLKKDLVLGLRGDVQASFGDVPFYAYPFIRLRGAPAMRYQGESVAFAEAELRWRFWKRFSLIAFGGAGVSERKSGILEGSDSVFTGGAGFRYELASRYDLHMGLDIGHTSDGDTGFYVTFGSAWMRF